MQDGSGGPDGNGGRPNLRRQLRTYSPAQTALERGGDPAPRPRQSRPARIPFDNPGASRPIGIGTSAISRVVLLGGMLLAIVGVVHASWPSAEDPKAQPTVAEAALNKQIAQLRAELDRERAEKSELADKLAAAKVPAPQPEPEPVSFPEKSPPQTTPPPMKLAAADESSLPEPMAPSVELMLSDSPLNAVPIESSVSGSASASFGIHLASFADRTMAERGWVLLQRNHPAALGQLRPRVDQAQDDKGNAVFLLIAGPFDTEDLAAAHCSKINTQVVFCKPRPFTGAELAAAASP